MGTRGNSHVVEFNIVSLLMSLRFEEIGAHHLHPSLRLVLSCQPPKSSAHVLGEAWGIH